MLLYFYLLVIYYVVNNTNLFILIYKLYWIYVRVICVNTKFIGFMLE